MIAVIADDFTGAAEIGGIALRHGFRVVVDTKVGKTTDTDVLVIATDTRSLMPGQAAQTARQTTSDLLAINPCFIYKKVDSLLRGNVAEELLAQLSVSGKSRALTVPANPDLGRTIRDGVYYFDGVPLSELGFHESRGDGHSSSLVTDLLGKSAAGRAGVISAGDEFPDKELIVGNVSDSEDLGRWVGRIDSQTIPAGGSGFFEAILKSRKGTPDYKGNEIKLGRKALYVCGSAFEGSRSLVRTSGKEGLAVIYMPERLFCEKENTGRLMRKWTDEIAEAIKTREKVVIAVGSLDCDDIEDLSLMIRQALAEAVEGVLRAIAVDELMIEGGATSFSVIRKLGYTRFYPVQELGPGVVRMKIEGKDDMHLTLKPGSYAWPAFVWNYR